MCQYLAQSFLYTVLKTAVCCKLRQYTVEENIVEWHRRNGHDFENSVRVQC